MFRSYQAALGETPQPLIGPTTTARQPLPQSSPMGAAMGGPPPVYSPMQGLAQFAASAIGGANRAQRSAVEQEANPLGIGGDQAPTVAQRIGSFLQTGSFDPPPPLDLSIWT